MAVFVSCGIIATQRSSLITRLNSLQRRQDMKIKIALLSSLVVLAFIASGCGMIGTLTGKNAGTVSDLWSDVPAFSGATKSNIDIPLPVNLMIQGFMQAANNDNSSDTKLDKFDFIAYDTTSTPADVSSFYTADKMKAAGWDQE